MGTLFPKNRDTMIWGKTVARKNALRNWAFFLPKILIWASGEILISPMGEMIPPIGFFDRPIGGKNSPMGEMISPIEFFDRPIARIILPFPAKNS